MVITGIGFRIFIAVLGDVLEEQKSLEVIIDELNEMLKSYYDIRIEKVRCETHTGFGKENRSLFDGQIPGNYDFFIALFGNPVNTQNTNTLDTIKEEFYRNFELHKADPKSVKIMLLFKEEKTRRNDIDVHLLKRIQGFKSEVENSNFYFSFKTVQEFENLIKDHLGQKIKELVNTPQRELMKDELQSYLESKSLPKGPLIDEDILKDRIADSIDKIEVITTISKFITEGVVGLHNQISNDNMIKQMSPFVKTTGMTFRRSTYFLTNFERMMEAVLPIIMESVDDSMQPYIELIDKKLEFVDKDSDDIRIAALKSINSLNLKMTEFNSKISNLRKFVEDLDLNDIDFKNACGNTLGLISKLLDYFENKISQLRDIDNYIRSLLQNRSKNPTNNKIKNRSELPIYDTPPIIPENNSSLNVFISYARENQKYFIGIKKYLKSLERSGTIKVYADDSIQAGAKWRRLIERYVQNAQVAILLVSVNYIESDFIYDNELIPLIEANHSGRARIIPIIIDYCPFTEDEKLKELQAVNDPKIPLCELSEDKHGKIYREVVKHITEYAEELRKTAGGVDLLDPDSED